MTERRWCSLVWCLCVCGLLTGYARGQDTHRQEGCSFYDSDNTIYNVVLSKGRAGDPQSCTSSQKLETKFKEAESRTLEISHEVMRLQGMMLALIQKNENLNREITSLEKRLAVTSKALARTNTNQPAKLTDCPPGFMKNSTLASCYIFIKRYLHWFDASYFCSTIQARLVTIETEMEQEYLTSQIKNSPKMDVTHIWIGGNDLKEEGKWVWGATDEPVRNYTNWLIYPHPTPVQQPDNYMGREHCLMLNHGTSYQWNDADCYHKFYSICEVELDTN